MSFKEKDDVRLRGEIVDFSHPIWGASADSVSGERGVNVTITKNNVTGPKKGDELSFVAVGKICCVNQTKSSRGQEGPVLPFARCRLDENRRIPFAKENPDSLLL